LSEAGNRLSSRLAEPAERLSRAACKVAPGDRRCRRVLEAHLQLRLCLYAPDVHLDLPQVLQREVRFQLLHIDAELVDLDLADVNVDVRIVAPLATLEVRTVQLAPAARQRGGLLAPASDPVCSCSRMNSVWPADR
jgi:hypothetical protein